jgi:cell division septation protein DedD
MAKDSQKKDGLRKDGTSHRTRAGGNRNNRGTPRILIGALVVVVIGAALLFWPKGGSVPTGIGEHQSVVTLPDSTGDATALASSGTPRSGDVDITGQGQQVTAEKPAGQAQTPPEETKTVEVTPPAAKATTSPKPSSPKPVVPAVVPNTSGKWAVQTGGFGDAANADKEAARLKQSGWDAMVRAGSNSQGDMVYRVWIGYFSSRDKASTFILQNKKHLKDAFPVHR